jgi:hypothetical protein
MPVPDYSSYDAADHEKARDLFLDARERWKAAMRVAQMEDGDKVDEALRLAFEWFRAAEQIADAYFWEHDVHLEDDVERMDTEIQEPAYVPTFGSHRPRVMSPEYRDRLKQYIQANAPELLKPYQDIFQSLEAMQVIQ